MTSLGLLLAVLISLSLVQAQVPDPSVLLQPCPTTNCPAIHKCPNRPGISCLIDRSLAAGQIDVKMMVRNTAFDNEFSTLASQLDYLEDSLQAGSIPEFPSVVQGYLEIVSGFRKLLVENCIIPVRGPLMRLLEADIDETLDSYYTRFLRHNEPMPRCPNRPLVIRQLKMGQSQGFLNALRMILMPNMEPVMGDLPAQIHELVNLIDTQNVASILEIAENMVEYKAMFVQMLQERCAFFIRDDLLAAIEASFDGRCEELVERFKGHGGSNPEFCPNRNAILQFIQQAAEQRQFDALGMITDPSLEIEFGSLATQFEAVRNNIHSREYASVGEVLTAMRSLRNSFIVRLESDPGCVIPIRDDVRGLIYESFEHYTLAAVGNYARQAGTAGVAGCPSRAIIERLLIRMAASGNFNVTAIIYHPRLEAEFGTIKAALEQLHTRIQVGNVVDRGSIAEDLAEYATMISEVCSEICQIEDPTGRMGDLLINHFDGAVENYCDDFRQLQPQNKVNQIRRKFKKTINRG